MLYIGDYVKCGELMGRVVASFQDDARSRWYRVDFGGERFVILPEDRLTFCDIFDYAWWFFKTQIKNIKTFLSPAWNAVPDFQRPVVVKWNNWPCCLILWIAYQKYIRSMGIKGRK